MIKLHDTVAVNELNIVSIKNDGEKIVVFMWNNRAHCVTTDDPEKEYNRVIGALKDSINFIKLGALDITVNMDAITSIAKIRDGVVINLVTNNRIIIDCEGQDETNKQYDWLLSVIN